MNKYVIIKYIRLSVDDGITESLSIPNQRALLDRHIDGLEIPGIEVIELVDNGFTGTNMERPAVQELLDMVRSGGVNCICVKDFSRFSRNAMDSGYFIEQVFPLYGVRFISVSDNFDSNDYKNDTGGIDVAFKFLMHEYYSKDLSVKVKSALRVKQLNGEHTSGNAPFGYRIGLNKKLEIEPETAETVRVIFKLASEGSTTTAIRDALIQKKCPTPKECMEKRRGKDITPKFRWDTAAITKILTDERYTGTHISGKYGRIAVGDRNCILNDQREWIVIPDNHPAIIGREDFLQAQGAVMIKGSQAVKEATGSRAAKRIKKDGSANAIANLYGYTLNKKREAKINPKPAAAIRLIFQMTLGGSSVPQICEALTQAGIPTPGEQKAMDRGEKVALGKAWVRGAVNSILREVQYTVLRYNR
jgi:DNA invertase Pin-like site-specific DNA recombinase